MGLALVEVVIVIEDAFGIPIPDEDMNRIPTPRALVEYLVEKLQPSAELAEHSTQRAFTALSKAVVDVVGPLRSPLLPSTTWDSILPGSHLQAAQIWRAIEDHVGGPLAKGRGAQWTVGQTAIQLSDRGTPGPQDVAALRTREDLLHTVRRLIKDELEVKEFTDDTPFEAMGLG